MRRACISLLLMVSVACGGYGGSTPTTPTPPTPTPPTPAPNRAPTVSATASPAFGIHGLTTFTITATGSDPDSDALTYSWSVGDGSSSTSASFTRVFTQGGSFTPTVTVDDGRGGTASASTAAITVGSMTGSWRGTSGPSALGTYSFTLSQENTGRITGTYFDSVFGAGQLDAASTTNRIDAQGAIEMRVKQGPFSDWTFRGQMDQTGRRITGGIFGSGFNGQPFTIEKS